MQYIWSPTIHMLRLASSLGTRLTSLSKGLVQPRRNVGPTLTRFYGSEPSVTVNKGQVCDIKAYYLSRDIDIIKTQHTIYPTTKHTYMSRAVVITFDEAHHQHIVIFKYGSVVFCNFTEELQKEHIRRIYYQTDDISGVSDVFLHDYDEEYQVIVKNSMEKPSYIKSDYSDVKTLDLYNLEIVSTVLAQTVALNYYTIAVDKMLETFMKINSKIEETGKFDGIDQTKLHKLLALHNTVVFNLFPQMGIFEGADATWDNSDYRETWEALRKEFEVDSRFKDLSRKLESLKENTNNTSNRLENLIIILIGCEIVIGIIGLVMHYMLSDHHDRDKEKEKSSSN